MTRPPGTAGPSAREEVLSRLRDALAAAPPTARAAAGEVPRDYRRAADAEQDPQVVAELFVARVQDHGALVLRRRARDVPAAVAEVVAGWPTGPVALPPGLPPAVVAALQGRETRLDGDPEILSAAELDACPGVITTAAAGVAETGTVVLDGGPGQGRRALTLVPDRHLLIIELADVVESVPAALVRLDVRRPLTLISGPSATSDIELSRVEGVHGPRALTVVLVEG